MYHGHYACLFVSTVHTAHIMAQNGFSQLPECREVVLAQTMDAACCSSVVWVRHTSLESKSTWMLPIVCACRVQTCSIPLYIAKYKVCVFQRNRSNQLLLVKYFFIFSSFFAIESLRNDKVSRCVHNCAVSVVNPWVPCIHDALLYGSLSIFILQDRCVLTVVLFWRTKTRS